MEPQNAATATQEKLEQQNAATATQVEPEPQNAATATQEEPEPQNAAIATQKPASGAAGPSTAVPDNPMVVPAKNMAEVPIPATYPVDAFQDFVSRLVVLDPMSAQRIQELYEEIQNGPFGGPVGRRIRLLAQPSVPASSSSSSSGGSNDRTVPLPSFLEHLAELPFILEAMARFQETYHVLKKSNRLISLYLNSVEHVAHKAVKVSLPFCRTAGCCLSVPIKIVDNIALNTMMLLEEKIPEITLPSDQMLESAKRRVSQKLKPCTNCALGIMRYVRGTLSQSLAKNENSQSNVYNLANAYYENDGNPPAAENAVPMPRMNFVGSE